MASLDHYIEQQAARGRLFFSRKEALTALQVNPTAFTAAVTRLIRKRRLANPRHGFFLILRPEDQIVGAPDPARWIDPLMRHQQTDYRISLLRAGAFHGSSHQAAMVFQVIVPRQLRAFELGRHRFQFIYQAPKIFAAVNIPAWLDDLRTDTGLAKVAGVELTLLDCARYFHRSGGINGVAQIANDLGSKADPRTLSKAAAHYENASVRRLGYLLELAGHSRQARALEHFADTAKSMKLLDPSARPITKSRVDRKPTSLRWKLSINESVEIDT